MSQHDAHSKKYEMFVIAFEAESRAREARAALLELDHSHYLDLKESAVLTRDAEGNILFDDSSDQTFNIPTPVTNSVRILLSILALPLGLPEMSVPIAERGDTSTITRDLGFKAAWLEELGNKLQPGSSAIVALVKLENAEACRKIAQELEGGHLLQHTLTEDHFRQLNELLP